MLISKKTYTASALCASVLFLGACGSNGESNNSVQPQFSIDDAIETPPVIDSSSGTSKDMVGFWVLCNELLGINEAYEFTDSTFKWTLSSGSCKNVNRDTPGVIITGSYSIIGTTTAGSGHTALVMEFLNETYGGLSLEADSDDKEQVLVYTETPGELVFSVAWDVGEDPRLQLLFKTPFLQYP